MYDGDGRRVKSTITGTTYFVGNIYEKTGTTETKYYYAGGSRVAMRVGGTGNPNYLLSDHLGSTTVTTDYTGSFVSELRYKPWGEVRSGSAPTKYTYTGQYSNVSDFGLLFYNARWYDPYLNRWTQPDTIVPDPSNPQALDRYAYTLNHPVRYTDPSGHAYCPYMECDIVVTAHDEKMHWRGNLRKAAEDLVGELGGINDLEAMTSIIAAGASAYRSFERLLPELSNIFLGTSSYGPGTLIAALGPGCAGVGRDPSACPTNESYFVDTGFHPDFQDQQNQLFHLWAYIAETAAPGNAMWGAFGNRSANIGNYVHEVVQSGFGIESNGTSWNDYVLSEAGMQIGALITDQSISPAELVGTIMDTVGQQGPGSAGMLEALLEVNGPLGAQ